MITDKQAFLDPLLDLCKRAGDAIMRVYEKDPAHVDVHTKADDSPVTAADHAAHDVLMQGLRALSPETPILSEEGEMPSWPERQAWSQFWIVDPLDGTKDFIARNGEFTVNVALIEQGVPVLGVVYAPAMELGYVGVPGLGAWKYTHNQPEKIHVRPLPAPGIDTVKVVASRRHGSEAVEALMAKIQQSLGKVETCNMGSSFKLCLVAEGRADLYPRLAPTCEWDTAAAQAVVEAAGGTVLADSGQVLRYNAKDSLLNPHFYVIGDTAFDWHGLLDLPR